MPTIPRTVGRMSCWTSPSRAVSKYESCRIGSWSIEREASTPWNENSTIQHKWMYGYSSRNATHRVKLIDAIRRFPRNPSEDEKREDRRKATSNSSNRPLSISFHPLYNISTMSDKVQENSRRILLHTQKNWKVFCSALSIVLFCIEMTLATVLYYIWVLR